MKTFIRYTLIIVVILILTALSLQACTQTVSAQQGGFATSNSSVTALLAGDPLTEEEIDSLIFMREEEKLAHDVYLALHDLWGLPLFNNIARSEQTHTDAIKRLLDAFGIPDPADTSPVGEFEDPKLQSLYDELIQTGSHSLADALKVGADIEQIDILDLEAYLEVVENESIRRVYENLLRGSTNHLRAFTRTLERNERETYEPQYMEEVDYDVIVTASSRRGLQGRQSLDRTPSIRGGRNRR